MNDYVTIIALIILSLFKKSVFCIWYNNIIRWHRIKKENQAKETIQEYL